MSKRFSQLIDTDQRGFVMNSIRNAVVEFVGPKTVKEIWDKLSEDSSLIGIRDSLPLRDSATSISITAMDTLIRQPTLPSTVNFLRLIQQNTDREIFPGSYEDLNLRNPKLTESNPDN